MLNNILTNTIRCLAITNRGLEKLLINEINQIGSSISAIEMINAGILFSANFIDVMKINLLSKIATRVMIELKTSGYQNEDDIYKFARQIPFEKHFGIQHSFKVKTTAINCELKSLNFINLRIKDAICDRFNGLFSSRPNVDRNDPEIRIFTFLTKNTITIYLDTSGEQLFKRGYKQEMHEFASMKENLAYALIKLSGWDATLPLYDPMAGSGTILYEAALLAMNIIPNLDKSFAFKKFNYFDQHLKEYWSKLYHEAKSATIYPDKLKLIAGDISHRATNSIGDNLKFFGDYCHTKSNLYLQNYDLYNYHKLIDDCFTIRHGDFLKLNGYGAKKNLDQQVLRGVIVSNLPYGNRMSPTQRLLDKKIQSFDKLDDHSSFYKLLGDKLKREYKFWDVYFFTSDPIFVRSIGLRPSKKYSIYNSNLECTLYNFKIY